MITRFRVWCKNEKKWEKDLCYLQQNGRLYQQGKGSERLVPILEKNHQIMPATGFIDKNGMEIFTGDITMLEVDGEQRFFEVQIKQVIRKVKNHPTFVGEYAKVALAAVVFLWEGYELFPCVDNDGTVDTAKMVIVGNIFENPELLEET